MNNGGPALWYPGHKIPLIRRVIEFCMTDITRRIEGREEAQLSVGQYNSVYEAVEKTICFMIEQTGGKDA